MTSNSIAQSTILHWANKVQHFISQLRNVLWRWELEYLNSCFLLCNIYFWDFRLQVHFKGECEAPPPPGLFPVSRVYLFTLLVFTRATGSTLKFNQLNFAYRLLFQGLTTLSADAVSHVVVCETFSIVNFVVKLLGWIISVTFIFLQNSHHQSQTLHVHVLIILPQILYEDFGSGRKGVRFSRGSYWLVRTLYTFLRLRQS